LRRSIYGSKSQLFTHKEKKKKKLRKAMFSSC
jgi:hypothetical protein